MNEIQFPLFIALSSEDWEFYNNAALIIIREKSEGYAEKYSNPYIDKTGQKYLIVNEEISDLFPEEDLLNGLQYDQIEWPVQEFE